MPKMPEVTLAGPVRSGVVPIAAAQRPFAVIAEAGATIAEIGFQDQAQQNQIKRSSLFAEKTTALLTELDSLRSAARDADDIEGISDAYGPAAQEAVEGLRESFDDEIVGAEFDNFAVKHVAAGAFDVSEIQRERRLDRVFAKLPGEIKSIQDSRARADTNVQREAIGQHGRELMRVTLGSAGEDESKIEAAVRAFDQQNDLNDYERIVNNDPELALEIASDPALFQETFPHLGEEDRPALQDNAERELRRALRDGVAASARAEKAAAGEILDRILLGDEHQDGRISESDIIRSSLGPTLKEHMVKLLRSEQEGVDLDATNNGLTNELWKMVRDPNNPNHISDSGALIPFVGNGLSRADADKMVGVIERRQNVAQKAEDDKYKEFLDFAEGQITNVIFGLKNDQPGQERFYNFQAVFAEAFDKEVRAGKNPFHLLTPGNPDYMGSLIVPFMRSQQEQIQGLVDVFDDPRGGVLPSGVDRAQFGNDRQNKINVMEKFLQNQAEKN